MASRHPSKTREIKNINVVAEEKLNYTSIVVSCTVTEITVSIV
jgi:hypothetical protein